MGAKVTSQEFLDWFDGYTGDRYDPSVCTYTVNCYGSENYEDIANVTVNFCTDNACFPVTSNDSDELNDNTSSSSNQQKNT